LRNPQELAFDEYGNLFTADNNGDGGDKARWHYVVEGADFGWRIGWQWLEARAYQPKMGPWNGERLWHLAESNTAAYLLPPLAHIGHGPAGLAYNPGTGLPAQFDRHFFLCDFPGHVLTWTNIPDGASFKVGPVLNFFGDLGPTDVAFHPDGGVLVSDWFKSFDKSDKGRIYRIHDPATDKSAAVQETKRLLAEGMRKRSVKELADLLGHMDMRVRLEAQWEIAERAKNDSSATKELIYTINPTNANSMSRLHATRALGCFRTWALATTNFGMHHVRAASARYILLSLFDDRDEQVRVAAVDAFSRDGQGIWFGGVLSDESPRVRLAAIRSLGHAIADPRLRGEDRHRNIPLVLAGLLKILEQEGSDDYLRHSTVIALARIGDTNALLAAAFGAPVSDPARLLVLSDRAGSETGAPRPVRLGVLLALRRLGSSEVARFLSDPDPQLVLEAARAINDVPIPAAYPQLAALVAADWRPPVTSSDPASNQDPTGARQSAATETTFFTLRRALNASFRIGQPSNAQALAEFAARSGSPEPLRIEALELLSLWPKPPGRDHFMGLWRPLPPRDGKPAADALRPVIASLLRDAPKDVRLEAARTAAVLGVKDLDFFALVTDSAQSPELRVIALNTLADWKDPRLAEAVKVALSDRAESLRIAASRLRGAGDAAQLAKALETGSIAERQSALASLGAEPDAAVEQVLLKLLDALLTKTLPKELELDVTEAARKRASQPVQSKLKQIDSRDSKDDPLALYRPALHGGNAALGKTIFIENQQIACFRCHKIHGEGGDVGPDLTGLGEKKSREYLLESLVQPNKQIAAGFESVLLTMKGGAEFAGLVKSETDDELVLNSPEDGLMTLKKSDIVERRRGLSAMPEEMVTFISKRELRDLIEFLATMK